MPQVSVVMNCFNGAKYLREAIESVYQQTERDWEIVFWDNGSSDESAAIAQDFSDGRLRYFRSNETVSLGNARNLAIAECRGELIAFLDCDDVWLPSKLELQLPLFRSDESVGLVYSDVVYFTNDGREMRLYETRLPVRGHCFGALLNSYAISIATAVVRKKALDSLRSWFNPRFSAIEEHDVFVRIGVNWKVDYVDKVLARWRVHGESLTWSAPARFDTEKAEMLELLAEDELIVSRHGQELKSAIANLEFALAKGSWSKGDTRDARARAMRARSSKMMLLWLLTFIPYAIVMRMYRFSRPTLEPERTATLRQTVAALGTTGLRHTRRTFRSLKLIRQGQLRVLLVHDVAPYEQKHFERLLRRISAHWTFVSPERFSGMLSGEEPVRGRNVLLTFDDGYMSSRTVAEAILAPMKIQAIFFVTELLLSASSATEARDIFAKHVYPGLDEGKVPRHWDAMRWRDIEALSEQGHTIGSHTLTHKKLSTIASTEERRQEICLSADVIERRLGAKVSCFAYPFGNALSIDAPSAQIAHRRYTNVFSGVRGDNAGLPSGYMIRRESILPADPVGYVEAILEGVLDLKYWRARARIDKLVRASSANGRADDTET